MVILWGFFLNFILFNFSIFSFSFFILFFCIFVIFVYLFILIGSNGPPYLFILLHNIFWTNFFKKKMIIRYSINEIHLNFRFPASFEKVVPWHSGNYRVQIHSQMSTWNDNNIQSNTLLFEISFFYYCFQGKKANTWEISNSIKDNCKTILCIFQIEFEKFL